MYMSSKALFGLLVGGAFAASMLLAPVLASAVNGFLTIQNAKVFVNPDTDRIREILVTEGLVPTDGSAGAFGYGTITNDGDAIFVTTTHAGVVDSEKQKFIADPVFHNHLVRLGAVDACGSDPGVIDITWQSPGRVAINNHRVLLSQIPTGEVDATHSITGTPLSMTLGDDVAAVVSFQLSPVFTSGGLQAVCVTNIQPAENLNVVEVD
jgi:hypothetical protein